MKTNYKEYKTLDRQIDHLYEGEKFIDAIALLEKSYADLPDYDFELKSYSIFCYLELKNYDKCVDLLVEGLSKGYFYDLEWDLWSPLRDNPKWSGIERQNRGNRDNTQKKALMEYTVLTPERYDESKNYPLFLTLHGDGNGCNIAEFIEDWQPTALLKRGFIVAYVQSSQVRCTSGFGWTSDYPQSRKEISDAYRKICDTYPVDQDQVLVGGFSGGAMASLNLMMNDTFPMKGIVALCPNETENCNEENIKKAALRGMRMVLLEGENSGEVPFHLSMMKLAEKYKLPSKYIINKGAGHSVPENFGDVINQAVDFIIKENY